METGSLLTAERLEETWQMRQCKGDRIPVGELYRHIDVQAAEITKLQHVRACNSHDELLTALIVATAEIVSMHETYCQHNDESPHEPAQESAADYCPTVAVIRQARAAIAKAQP